MNFINGSNSIFISKDSWVSPCKTALAPLMQEKDNKKRNVQRQLTVDLLSKDDPSLHLASLLVALKLHTFV